MVMLDFDIEKPCVFQGTFFASFAVFFNEISEMVMSKTNTC